MTCRNGAQTYFTPKFTCRRIGVGAAAIAIVLGLCAATPSQAGRVWCGAAAIKSRVARQLAHVHFRQAIPQRPDRVSGDADDYVQRLTSISGVLVPWE